MAAYEEEDKKPLVDYNAFKHWRRNKNEFSGLSRLSKCVLCIPAIHTFSKKCFSLSGRSFKQSRTRLRAERLNSFSFEQFKIV